MSAILNQAKLSYKDASELAKGLGIKPNRWSLRKVYKGYELFKNETVSHIYGMSYGVKSRTRPGLVHIVSYDGKPHCTCESHRKDRKMCLHMVAVHFQAQYEQERNAYSDELKAEFEENYQQWLKERKVGY